MLTQTAPDQTHHLQVKKRKKKEGGSLQTKQNGTVKKRQCPQTTTFEEKGEAKQIRT